MWFTIQESKSSSPTSSSELVFIQTLKQVEGEAFNLSIIFERNSSPEAARLRWSRQPTTPSRLARATLMSVASLSGINHISLPALHEPVPKVCLLLCKLLPEHQLVIDAAASRGPAPVKAVAAEIPQPLSADSAVLNLILPFFRHFHIAAETVFPKEWKHSHSTTNKKPTRHPYSRGKKISGNQSHSEI